MKRAIRNYSTDFLAMVALALVGVLVGGFILSNQRFYLPGWVPFVGTDFFALKAEMRTAQAITPGQGQTVAMAGVPVGEITGVELKNGRALVSMDIQQQYADDIHTNATILTRPKTGLNDMLLQLNPGRAPAPNAPDGYVIPVGQTVPNVNPDEVLAALDTDTRNYLKMLIGGAGEGLTGNRGPLAQTLRRFSPTARDVDKITKLLAVRREAVADNIHNLRQITEALAGNDKNLTAWVDSTNAVFRSFANQDQNLRAALGELPTALNATNNAVISANTLGQKLGPTLGSLLPFAQYLAPASLASQETFKATTPTLKNQLRPFSVAVQPTVANLKPATADLAAATPNLGSAFSALNYLTNALAYKSSGQESFLFYAAWLNHIGALQFTIQDAMGPVRRGLFLLNCANAQVLEVIRASSSPLGTLSNLVNAPTKATVCASTKRSTTKATAASTRASGGAAAGAPATPGVSTTTTPATDAPPALTTTGDTPPPAPAATTPTTTDAPALTSAPPDGGN